MAITGFLCLDKIFQPTGQFREKLYPILCFHVTSSFPKLKITNPSAVLVSSDVRPSNDLTFCNVHSPTGLLNLLERAFEFQCFLSCVTVNGNMRGFSHRSKEKLALTF